MDRFNFVVTGFYGTGKTTALEVAIDKIVEKQQEFPNARIIFVYWDESSGLKEVFAEKFKKIKEQNFPHLKERDSLQVGSIGRLCQKYKVKPMIDETEEDKFWNGGLINIFSLFHFSVLEQLFETRMCSIHFYPHTGS